MSDRMWYEERTTDDAPAWFTSEQASAWADGWNAAVAACAAQQSEIARREGGG